MCAPVHLPSHHASTFLQRQFKIRIKRLKWRIQKVKDAQKYWVLENSLSVCACVCVLPSRCVQMFPVSVWILKMLLKQARNEGMGGLWPWSRKSLSFSQSGSTSWGMTRHRPSHIWLVNKGKRGNIYIMIWYEWKTAAVYWTGVQIRSVKWQLLCK